MNLGDVTDNTGATVTLFLANNPTPTSAQIASFLQSLDASNRSEAQQALLAQGVAPADVATATSFLSGFTISTFWEILAAASAAVSAYHGYKRNQSVGWAVVWGLLGGLAPVMVPAIALAQGFGKKAA